MIDHERIAGEPVIARPPEELPGELPRGAQIPEDLDPLADGILMRHQQKWLYDESYLKLAEKGRRTGITFAEALDATLIAAMKRSAGGSNYFYIGDTKDKGREFIDYVAHFAKTVSKQLAQVEEFLFEDKQEDGTTKFISAFRIKFASGYRVEALSSRPANIRGLQGVVCIDEAAFHDNVREVLDAVNALLIWGGRVRVISTHNGVLSPFNELVKEARAGRVPFSVHHIPFSKAVENGLFKRVCYIKGEEWTRQKEIDWETQIRSSYGTRTAAMRQELDAIPAESEGQALTSVQIEACMIPDVPIVIYQKDDDFRNLEETERAEDAKKFCIKKLKPILDKLDKNTRICFGSDFARVGDVSAHIFRETLHTLTRRDVLVLEMSNVPFEQQRYILHYCIDRIPRLQAGALEAGGNGAWLAENTAIKFGSSILEVHPTQEFYRQEMPHYKAAFEERTVQIAKHDDILQDHISLQYIKGIIKVPQDHRFRGSDGRMRHGDTAIAGNLCHYASRSDTIQYGHEKVEKKPSGMDRGFVGAHHEDDGAFRMGSMRNKRGIY